MISIIVPTYNREMYIEECIKSILHQTYTDWELIIVDDGSDDNTVNICKQYADKNDKIRIILSQHQGVSSARNTGIKEAKGDFLFFIDSDDLIHPCLFNELMKIMDNPDIGAACCYLKNFRNDDLKSDGFFDFDLSEIVKDYTVLESEEFIEELFKRDGKSGAIGSKLFRKSYIEDLTFRSDLKKGEDTFFLYNYALGGGNLATLDAEWYFYRRHDDNSAAVLKSQFDPDDYLKAIVLMYDNEKNRGNIGNAKTLKWYIIDSTTQLYEFAREQKNKVAMKNIGERMLKILFTDRDGVATFKRKVSFILYAYCNPLHRIIKKFISADEELKSSPYNQRYQKDLVSIVTPVYNNEAYLSEMLESVLSQSYDNVQMILVSDGSTDSTLKIAESFRDKFKSRGFDYTIIDAEHKNASAAINKGLTKVRGEYIIWPDSDDLLTPDSIEKRVSFLNNNPDYTAVRSLPDYFDTKTGEPAKPRETITESDNENIFWDILEGRSYVSCGCYMLKSEELFKIYPDRKIPEYNVGQNFQMLLPYMYKHSCKTIPEKLYKVRVHSESHSVRKLSFISQYRVIKDFEKLIDEIAVISGIDSAQELKRINEWKRNRRVGLRWRTIYNIKPVGAVMKIYHKLKNKNS